MTHYVWPPFGIASELGEAAALCAWWFGAVRDSLGPAVTLSRTRPDLSLVRVPLPEGVDERIGLRLAKMNLRLESAASAEAFARLIVDSAEKPDGHIVCLRGRVPQAAADAFGASRVFMCDERLHANAALAFLTAAAALADAEPATEAWAGLRRATRDTPRIVVAGPDIARADAAQIAHECRFVTPELFVRLDSLDDDTVIVVALDDPVRHLGPSRSAASLRDVVIERVERLRNAYICVPREALGLMRSRVSGTLHNRLIAADCKARMDPGPATLLAAAVTICDTVDVLGFSGLGRPLPDDQIVQHPAYAASAKAPADLADILAEADVAGARVSVLGRTRHPGLAARDRGRVPTRLDLDGVRLGERIKAHRFPADGTSRAELSASLGGRGTVLTLSRIYETGEVDVAREIARYGEGQMADDEGLTLWPATPDAQVELILDALDRDSDLVLTNTPVRHEPAQRPGLSVDEMRALVRDMDGPAGPFNDEDDEIDAIRLVHRLVTRDLDRVHAPRMNTLSWRLQDRVFAFGPGTDWRDFNAARLVDEIVLAVDTPHDALPAAVRDGADVLIHLSTTPAARLANAAVKTAGNMVMVTTLSAAHRADAEDIVVDAQAFTAPGEDGAITPTAIAVGLLHGLRARPVILISADAGPFGGDVTALGKADDARSRAEAFHKFVRPVDWADAPRLLLVLAEGTSLDALVPLFSGLGGRLVTLVPRDGRIIAADGDHFLKGPGLPRPAFVPGDPAIADAITRHHPAVMLCEGRVPPPINVHVPLIALGEGTWTARANLDQAALPRADAPLPSPAALDMLRLSLVAAVKAAQTITIEHPPELAEDEEPEAPVFSAQRKPAGTRGGGRHETQGVVVVSGHDSERSTASARFTPPTQAATARWIDSPTLEDEGTTMADTSKTRQNPFRAFWPWPGTALFLLVALWLFYMAWMATAPDLRTAFVGLGVLLLILSVFGMKPRRRAAAAPLETNDAPAPVTRRSSIPDEGIEAPDKDREEDRALAGLMPRNARMRRAETAAAPETPAETAVAQAEPLPKVAEPADTPEAVVLPKAVAPLAGAPVQTSDAGKLLAKVNSLEALINREKAERGAQFAQINARLRSAEETSPAPAAEANTDALNEKLSQFLTITAFNDVMNQKVLGRIAALIESKIDEALAPEALRTRVAALRESAAPVAPDAPDAPVTPSASVEPVEPVALAERIASVEPIASVEGDNAAQNALRGEIQSLRETLEASIGEARDTAESAARLANRITTDSGEGRAAMRRSIEVLEHQSGTITLAVDELKKAQAASTPAPDADAAMRKALAEAEARMERRLAEATASAPEADAAVRKALAEAEARMEQRLAEATASAPKADDVVRKALAEAETRMEQRLAEAAASAPEVDAAVRKALAEAEARMEQRLAEVTASAPEADVAVRKALAEAEAGIEARITKAAGEVDDLRGNLAGLTERIARMDGEFRHMLEKVAAIGEGMSVPQAPAKPSTVKSEVDALRDALTTIIEQNHEIREKQEVLTARFDPPVRIRAQRLED